jgi:hypothetical protein
MVFQKRARSRAEGGMKKPGSLKPGGSHRLTQMQDSAPVKPRGRPSDEGRFIWLSSLAAERIINELGQTQAAFGIAVYVALCRISGKARNATIEATVQKIAGMCRLSYPKTFYILDALQDQAKVIAINRSQKRSDSGRVTQAPNTYTLIRLNSVKAGRLNSVKAADLTGTEHSGSDNPKDSVLKKNREEKEIAHCAGNLPGAEPAVAISKKITWDAEGEP